MVSNSSKTALRRRLKNRKQGRDRKRALEREGTTPKFPIHPEQQGSSKGSASKGTAAKPKPASVESEKSG